MFIPVLFKLFSPRDFELLNPEDGTEKLSRNVRYRITYVSIPVLFKLFSPRDFGFLNPEDGTENLSRNVGKKLLLLAA